MKWLKNLLKLAVLTIVIQLVADHIMRTNMKGATYIFVAAIMGGCGLLGLLIVKLIRRQAG